MAITNVHRLYDAKIGSTVLGGVNKQSIGGGGVVDGAPSGAEVYNRFLAMRGQEPVASFDTWHVALGFALVGLSGAVIGDLTGGLILYAQKGVEGSVRAGATSHRSYTFNEGIIYPTSLSVSGQGDAVLSYAVIATYDGSNDPIVLGDSVSLPAITGAEERFGLGPVTLESISLPAMRGFDIDFGIEAAAYGTDGNIWPTYSDISMIKPRITFRGIDSAWLKSSAVPLAGLKCTNANTKFYLRRRTLGGGYVSDVTATHCKFTATGMAHVVDAFDASGNELAECSVALETYYDGTNAPLIYSAAAIT